MDKNINYKQGLYSSLFFGTIAYASNQNLGWFIVSILFGFVVGIVFADFKK